MSQWAEKSEGIKTRLKLRTEPIAFRRLEDAEELERIEGVIRWSQGCVFCQIPYMARVSKLTVAVTSDDELFERCFAMHDQGQVLDGRVPAVPEAPADAVMVPAAPVDVVPVALTAKSTTGVRDWLERPIAGNGGQVEESPDNVEHHTT